MKVCLAIAGLGAQFERASGHKVTIDFAVNPRAKKRIDGGEAPIPAKVRASSTS